MSKIIPFPARPLRDDAPGAPGQPARTAKILQRLRSQARRERELRKIAARYFAEELARSEARLARRLEAGETNPRTLQALRDEVAYYKRQIADNTPTATAQESGIRVS
jgi:predicted nucleic acid-binding protein